MLGAPPEPASPIAVVLLAAGLSLPQAAQCSGMASMDDRGKVVYTNEDSPIARPEYY